jgi:hypothetical protein
MPFPRPHPGACVKGGFEPAYRGGSIRNLHHQRRLSREDRGKPSYKNSIAALSTRRILRTIRVRSAIGIRLIASFPPAGPAHLGTRLSSASPGIRVSRSGMCRDIRTGRAAGNKKPSGAAGSGGSVRSGLSILRSGKIAPMSRACDIDWPQAIRQSCKSFVAVLHHRVQRFRKRKCSRGRGTYARNLRMSSDAHVKITRHG